MKIMVYWGRMKKTSFFFCIVAHVAFALPPVRPVLPPVESLDTETVTNVPFTAWQKHLRHFTVKWAFNATPSNNNGVEVFAELAASKPSWLHSSGWNRLRLVGCGENVRAGERFFAQITPDGTSVRMR